ncbi:MAG: Fic family protein [Deltaproteobacteria bacterium]|nr:Fic family protein [Deltaproteobacteria bacterium]
MGFLFTESPTPDALERHVDLVRSLGEPADWDTCASAFERFNLRANTPRLSALDEYTTRLDLPAHCDARRNALTAAANAWLRENLDTLGAPTGASVARWMELLLGRSSAPRLRQDPAYARGGLHRYSLGDCQLESLWSAALDRANGSTLHLCARAATLYLDALFLHPYDNGNARLARALVYWLMQHEQHTSPAMHPLVLVPLRPGNRDDLQRLAKVIAVSASRENLHCKLTS